MPPTDPPERPRLPKLPPVRESAEHVFPPPADEPAVGEPAAAEPPRDEARAAAAAARARGPRAGATGATLAGADPGGRPARRERLAHRGRPALLDGGQRARRRRARARLRCPADGARDAQDARSTANPGTKRDVSLALTGGLAHVSHALLLDRPRGLVQDAIGRGDADEIDVAIVVPPTTVTPKPGTTPAQKPAAKPGVAKPPGKLAFTPKKKLRLWVAGDSLVITPGYAIVRAAGGSPVIESVGGVDGHVATGLTRPDVFNWFQQIATRVKELRPKVVVLNFGGNDDKGYMTGLPEGSSIGDFGSPSWSAEYLRRVRVVMDTVNRAGGLVVWIGLPITRSTEQTQRFDTLNAIVQKEAKRRPGKAIFIDTYTMFAGDDRRLRRSTWRTRRATP